MPVFKRPLLALSLSFAMLGVSPTAHAEMSSSVTQALENINLSARQRMLAQRMAGLSCLVHLNIDAEVHGAEALEAQALFATSLATLRDTNAEIGTARSDRPNILGAIEQVQTPLNAMAGYLTVLSTTGDVGPKRLEAIAATTEVLFDASETLTSRVQYAESQNLKELTLIQTMILNFSGRQRMLSEKAFKEFCLAEAGIDPAYNLEELGKTTTIFDNTMSALVNGLPGLIVAPPTPEIKAKLEETNTVWQPVKVILDRAVAGEIFDAHDIHYVTEELETVRILMDEAVELYEHYHEASS